mmetsp:Transcript_22191/g.34456  ORF Transcript_22191/g.34456 Transcript_22191/m.34456 type:complete len:82 (-) Transcript_22191:3-248(-)
MAIVLHRHLMDIEAFHLGRVFAKEKDVVSVFGLPDFLDASRHGEILEQRELAARSSFRFFILAMEMVARDAIVVRTLHLKN